jgi:FixJ family two-component response regulator
VERGRPLVAILEDEEPVRRALDRVLRASFLCTAAYGRGEDFLADLPALDPDCVLLDLNMPGLGGFETQRRLAEASPNVPVVVLTARDEPDTRERAMAAGASAFLSKPVDSHLLLDAIFRAIAKAASCAEDTWTTPKPAARLRQ